MRHRFFHSIAAALFLGFVAGCTPGQHDYERAHALAASGDIEAAIDCYQTAAAAGYKKCESYYQLGQLFEDALDQDAIAAWYYGQAMNLCPADSPLQASISIRQKKLNMQSASGKDEATIATERLAEQEAVIKILEERCADLTKWVQRLNDENMTLRQMLLERQNESTGRGK